MKLLGISCFYHDSAAVILENGNIITAVQEERFTRKKHDSSFPVKSIEFCLEKAGCQLSDLDGIVFYEDPELKYQRMLSIYKNFFPKSIPLFFKTFVPWFTRKRFWKKRLAQEIEKNFDVNFPLDKIHKVEHHLSHAASAFIPSDFDVATIVVVDGVGEFATTSIWKGEKNKITLVDQINFPNSLGLLYSAFTYYTGFKVNSGEYKVMGLAPYGNPVYVDIIKDKLIKLNNDGTYSLNMEYFDFAFSEYMTNEKFHDLFGGPPRESESSISQKEMDIARSLQDVLEEAMIGLVKNAISKTGIRNLCMAGGVALNCVANGKILVGGIVDDIWIQPAAGDAGGALGAVLYYHYCAQNNQRPNNNTSSAMIRGSYLGPQYSNEEAISELNSYGAIYAKYDFTEVCNQIASKISDGKVIGWFQGCMEFGPRALGNRSIIGDARRVDMQKIMNLKIKFRESFRPFAPAVLAEKCQEYFKINKPSPYMLIVAEVQDWLRIPINDEGYFGIDKLNQIRSKIPAVTHVDYSARIQTVHKETNSRFYELIEKFYEISGSPVLINTSFNVRGEPIVCTVSDAYRCFMRTEIDILVVNDLILYKDQQPAFADKEKWQEKYELD
ncbi:carbamoyltransferase [Daejeonella sp.]|uniref:carbamoyltransferase family protein n=1 Tax=Daejeonella sp. TaxID=2805397 RepID=UPI002D1E15B3|nr:carbamoyltransferase [Daejeonella sp.]HQT24907.1 carbamoyltransferase [Daejeonella sp.]HQT58856.1 carbamoyltransferase [Daejeonella sp.]